mmetsp:Transcript_49121/g.111401  ORF Transcript_49121/g.111401 Transcript_49121/m.111401 type:complete len:364 (+) Transcript_49121:40-1131(+)
MTRSPYTSTSLLLCLAPLVCEAFLHQPVTTSRRQRSSALESTASTSVSERPPSLQWDPKGYESWVWEREGGEKIKINYVAGGLDKKGTPLVLVHGFGASAFHWRYNVPTLAEERPVYALDLTGFGLSDKPLIEYNAELWRDQVGAFLEQVVKEPAVVAGNSLGGFTALYAASSFPKLTAGCVLLNAAGRFSSPDDAVTQGAPSDVFEPIKMFFSRAAIYGTFFFTKQPARIAQVLRQVYSVDAANVDDELVESIRFPSDTSPNCAEVFYRVITRTSSTKLPSRTIDALLPELTKHGTPLYLVWGESDPWIRPQVATKIQSLKPDAVRISIDAGHCPHDEKPFEVNAALLRVAKECEAKAPFLA